MKDLIARLESATGPDRELDQDIFHALGLCRKNRDGSCSDYVAPRYTDSIDIALTLLPEGWNTHGYSLNPIDGARAYMSLNYVKSGHLHSRGGHKSSVPIALCICAIKAREAK